MRKWSSFRWAAGYHLSLNGRLLIGHKVDICLESLISGQTDFYLMLAWSYQQGLSDSPEFGDVAHEDSVDEDGGPIRFYFQLNFSGNLGKLNPGVFFHLDCDALFFSGAHRNLLHEVEVSPLAHGDIVIAGKEEKLFGSLQFAQVADILTVDPDARGVFAF